ncbi:reverse transcriptase domain-containing protein [Caerostris extrusa]|uniref:Reverse transcriptase domain-containing protein n=1 Tax=Caerostris extrusa TaxID=172846 RepID=A0AAV4R495_CAEEX|nr:reverse transcriptase domain-containing protein [Caerostris extrusa]
MCVLHGVLKFHEYCIENWLKLVKASCPIDKKSIIRKDYLKELKNERTQLVHQRLSLKDKYVNVFTKGILKKATYKNMELAQQFYHLDLLLPSHTITVINAYHPDTSPIDTLFLQDLASTTAETKILFGDLNAKSPSWGNNRLDAKGKQIEDLIDDLNLTILNMGEITFVSKTNGTASSLDITAISYLSADKTQLRVLESAISDHYPVLTTFSMDQDSPVQVKRSWNFRKANWDGFTQELENLCSNLPELNNLEELLSLFTRNIRNAAKHHIPRGKRKNSWIPFWKDQNIEELIHERNSINQKLQVNNNEELRRKLVEISHKLKIKSLSASRKNGLSCTVVLAREKGHFITGI